MSGTAITANSSPVLDGWGWDDYWSCEDWIQWHKLMKEAWGRDVANYKFVNAFQQQTMGAAGYDCRSFNSSFREYARENGFYEALFQGIGILALPIGWTIDQVGNVGEVVGNTLGAASNVTKVIKDVLPILLFIAILFVIVYGYQRYLKTA